MSMIFAFAHCFASNSSGGRRRWHTNGHVISTVAYWSYLWEFPGSSSEHKKGTDVNWLGQRGTFKSPRHQKFCGTSSEVIFHQTSLPKTSSRQAIQLIQREPVPTCRTCVLPPSSFITSAVASAVTNCPMQRTWRFHFEDRLKNPECSVHGRRQLRCVKRIGCRTCRYGSGRTTTPTSFLAPKIHLAATWRRAAPANALVQEPRFGITTEKHEVHRRPTT